MSDVELYFFSLVAGGVIFHVVGLLRRVLKESSRRRREMAGGERIWEFSRVLVNALGVAKLAFPAWPMALSRGVRGWGEYRAEYQRFSQEIGYLEEKALGFIYKWMFEGRAYEEECRVEALEFLEDIRETVQFYEGLHDKYVAAVAVLEGDARANLGWMIEVRKAMYEAKERIQCA